MTKDYFKPFQTKWNYSLNKLITEELLFILESFKYRVRKASAEKIKKYTDFMN